ncbi:MAG TPA: hypothetical protein VK493_14020, partial [Bryobacteraceae bacterium]|nr:hypothetical protein [Bryobacteraceae bacterium]
VNLETSYRAGRDVSAAICQAITGFISLAQHWLKRRGTMPYGGLPKPAAGRATVQLLAMNDARRLELRTELRIRGEMS